MRKACRCASESLAGKLDFNERRVRNMEGGAVAGSSRPAARDLTTYAGTRKRSNNRRTTAPARSRRESIRRCPTPTPVGGRRGRRAPGTGVSAEPGMAAPSTPVNDLATEVEDGESEKR
jgi:hypothetical protein